MKAISLHQPYATAIALGLKKIETRHWSTDYRGPLVIHAARIWTKDQQDRVAELVEEGILPEGELPRGAIVAVCDLVKVKTTEELMSARAGYGIDENELRFGNYEPDRFGWLLANVRALPVPIVRKGRQSFFDVPDSVIEAALAE